MTFDKEALLYYIIIQLDICVFLCVFAVNVLQLFSRKNIFLVLSNEQDTEVSIKKLTLIKKNINEKNNEFFILKYDIEKPFTVTH